MLIPPHLHSAVLILAHLHLVLLISNYIHPRLILLGQSRLIGVDPTRLLSFALVHTCLRSSSVIHAQMRSLVVVRALALAGFSGQ
jgi:hypothetical protein